MAQKLHEIVLSKYRPVTPQLFRKLNHYDKIHLLETYGQFVATRKYYIYNIALYTLFGFYVEAWRFESCNEIAKTEIQFNEKEFENYLDDISIEELLDA